MFRFPYGDLHGLNLDWFLTEWKKFQASFTSAFTASVNTVGVNQPPDVDVTYDQNTGIYNFGFDLPEAVKPLTFQIGYTSSNSGTVIPTGITWQDTPPYVSAGDYLWTRCLAVYNDGQNFATYSVARQGIDGQGSPATTLPLMDGTAAIGASVAFARADHVHPTDTSKQDANDEGDGYFKSADGTLIQWGVASVTTGGTAQTNYPTQNPTQPAYRGYLEVTFSTEYYNTPSVCVGGDNALYGLFDAHDITTAGFMIEGFHNSLTTISVAWIAIGRWKA